MLSSSLEARGGLNGRFKRSRLYADSAKLAPKFGILLAAMGAPRVVKTDLRPWRSQIEALLAGIEMSPVIRRALLDAFEEHGLLAYTKAESEIAVDELVARFNQFERI